MRLLFVEPYDTGSHRLFREGYERYSRHEVESVTMPGHSWKWRLRGGALSLMDEIERRRSFDLIFTTSLFPLADLVAVHPRLSGVPRILYMHENQISYPVPKGETPDIHFAFTNISSCLAADRVLFNSEYHRRSFLAGVESVIGRMPDRRPKRVAERIEERSGVVPVGIDLDEIASCRVPRDDSGPPIIVWNHRWEFDKAPEVFFERLEAIESRGLDFRILLAGANSRAVPKEFLAARKRYGERIVSFGYIKDRREYLEALWRSHIAVSTAEHDFFGISMIEAALCGLAVIVPNDLAYPEVLAGIARFYERGHSIEAIEAAIRECDLGKASLPDLTPLERFSWRRVAPLLDGEAEALI